MAILVMGGLKPRDMRNNSLRDMLKNNQSIVRIYDGLKEFYYRYCISDETFIKKRFKKNLGRDVDLNNPVKYNDKLQWLKLNWYDPMAVKCADKYEVRQFVKDRIGSEYLNEIFAVYDSVDEINLEQLPTAFVLKGTHGSGFNVICKDKTRVDWNKEFNKMNRWLRTNYYWESREWVYKDIKPRIVCEKLLLDEDGTVPKDYKFFCFDGEPQFMFIASDRGRDTKFDFYDLDWNKLPVKQYYPTSDYNIQKPKNLNKILELSRKLSKGFPHVRVDFYLCGNDVIFGELTFFHFSGTKMFVPEKYDEIFGRYIDLSRIENKKRKIEAFL
ncbi:MAG: glycosyl transferase [Clostridiaceae bacterium]|nr:glycosyl transferase [Clostridiaceae bacterium]